MTTYTQQPSEVLDYDIDLTDWLATGDTVSGSTVTAETGLTVTIANEDTSTPKVWCSGGTDGTTYKVTVLITTSGGRTKEVDFKIKVRES